jgi:hypothetical protein
MWLLVQTFLRRWDRATHVVNSRMTCWGCDEILFLDRFQSRILEKQLRTSNVAILYKDDFSELVFKFLCYIDRREKAITGS